MASVNLVATTKSVRLNREACLQLFPHSVLASLLQDDPDATEIAFDNPRITAEALQALASIVNTRTLPTYFPDLGFLGHYLDVPLLTFMMTLHYVDFVCALPECNLAQLSSISESAYQNLLKFMAHKPVPALARHVFESVPPAKFHPAEGEACLRAAKAGQLYLVERLLQRGILGDYQDLPDKLLMAVFYNDNLKLAQLALKLEAANPVVEATRNHFMKLAISLVGGGESLSMAALQKYFDLVLGRRFYIQTGRPGTQGKSEYIQPLQAWEAKSGDIHGSRFATKETVTDYSSLYPHIDHWDTPWGRIPRTEPEIECRFTFLPFISRYTPKRRR